MQYLKPSFTMPQIIPSKEYCCDACVFGRGHGEHAEWCPKKPQQQTEESK
jgi:hypothetical protein